MIILRLEISVKTSWNVGEHPQKAWKPVKLEQNGSSRMGGPALPTKTFMTTHTRQHFP